MRRFLPCHSYSDAFFSGRKPSLPEVLLQTHEERFALVSGRAQELDTADGSLDFEQIDEIVVGRICRELLGIETGVLSVQQIDDGDRTTGVGIGDEFQILGPGIGSLPSQSNAR